MEIRTKLRIVLILSVVALVLKTVVFLSPGWVVINNEVQKPFSTETQPGQWSIDKHVSISFGVWFYRVCMLTFESNEDVKGGKMSDRDHNKQGKDQKCYHDSYKKKHHQQRIDYVGEENKWKEDEDFENGIPREFSEARDFISISVEVARHARLELAAYVTAGVILGMMGFVSAIIYTRENGLGKHAGRLACSTQVISSFCYWLAIVRAATYMIQLRTLRHHVPVVGQYDGLYFSLPWCLVVGAIGATIMDISSLFYLILISRDRKPVGAEYIFDNVKCSQSKISVIIPNGYEKLTHQSLEDASPPATKQDAGPFVMKQSTA